MQKSGDIAERKIKDQLAAQEKRTAELKTQMALQPKITQSDNFAADKLKSLNSLRMGMATTMTGAGSLTQPTALKTKLGA